MGRKKLAQVTRYGTIVLAFVQAIAMSIGFNAMAGGMLIADPSVLKFLIIAIVLTSGTAFLMWLGEQITAKDRKSTRLNSSHVAISYAVFCLKKKNNT